MLVKGIRKEERVKGSEWIPAWALDSMAYPLCDTCVWDWGETSECFSFMPRDGVEAPEPAEHRKYMDALVKLIYAADLTELGFKSGREPRV